MENLNLKYELNVSHKTSSALEVSVGSAKSFRPIYYLAKLRKRGEEERRVW